MATDIKDATIAEIAKIVSDDWKKPYFGAVPYIEAMRHFHKDGDLYGVENSKSICTYFLSNATTWRGETARVVKAELKRRFKL